jgi:hypothetical protein
VSNFNFDIEEGEKGGYPFTTPSKFPTTQFLPTRGLVQSHVMGLLLGILQGLLIEPSPKIYTAK